MEQEHSRSRRIAARKFMSSLDDLDSVFRQQEDESFPEVSQPPAKDFSTAPEQQLEDAVKDIEQFMAERPECNG